MENIFEQYKDKLPKSYLEFLSEMGSFEGFTDNIELGYIALWTTEELNDFRKTSEEFLGGDWFPVGSNGGGEMIVIKLDSLTKELFYIPFIPMSEEYAESFCDDFSIIYDAIKRTELKP
jgi:hypothetical protein